MPPLFASLRSLRAPTACCLLWAILATAAAAASDLPAPVSPGSLPQIPRIDAPLQADGRADEPAWADAAVFELAYETRPGDNTPPAARTVARVLYTEDALWLSFRAEDPDPTAIRAFLRDRDALYEDDFVGTNGVRVSHP